MWLRALPLRRYTYNHHAQPPNHQGSLRQTVGLLLSSSIQPIPRSWLRLTNTSAHQQTGLAACHILSIATTQCLCATYCLPHNTFNEYYPCQQRLPEWRPNQPQQSRQSSRPPKLKRATRCTGDRAQVGTSVSVTIITCSCNIIRLLHLPITQKEVRRRQGDL